jgi:hypothetical protein
MTVDPPCQPHPDSPVIIREAARLLAAARREKRPFDRLTEALRPADEAAAYRIQEQLHLDIAAAGKGTVAGYKIGCTTEVMQRYLEIGNPCAGTFGPCRPLGRPRGSARRAPVDPSRGVALSRD